MGLCDATTSFAFKCAKSEVEVGCVKASPEYRQMPAGRSANKQAEPHRRTLQSEEDALKVTSYSAGSKTPRAYRHASPSPTPSHQRQSHRRRLRPWFKQSIAHTPPCHAKAL